MFCRTLSVLLLGLVFAVKFGSDAYGMYNPGLGRFCSRDPIGYKDGKNLYSNYFQTWGVDPNGTECTSADCIDRCKTLPENVVVGGPGGAIGISHPRQACIDRCKDAEEKFNNWYNEQTKNGKPDYSSLPACPCSIRCSKTSICDLLSGRSAHYVPCSPPGFALVPSVAYPLYLQKFHPGHHGIFGLKAVLLNSARMIATLTLSHLDHALEQLTTQMRTRQSLATTDPRM